MDNKNEIKQKKEELTEKIKITEGELKDLRELCNHPYYKIKDVNPGERVSQLRKVCDFCDETIGYPTNQDLKNNGYDK